MSFWKARLKGIPSWEKCRVGLYTKGIVACGARSRGYKVGGLSETCAAKPGSEVGCRYVGVMGLERAGDLY